jgi:hypothetical protein
VKAEGHLDVLDGPLSLFSVPVSNTRRFIRDGLKVENHAVRFMTIHQSMLWLIVKCHFHLDGLQVLRAKFGGPAHCDRKAIIAAEPLDACGELGNRVSGSSIGDPPSCSDQALGWLRAASCRAHKVLCSFTEAVREGSTRLKTAGARNLN